MQRNTANVKLKTGNTNRFGGIFHDEGCQLMSHVDAASMSAGNAPLKNAVLFHHLAMQKTH